MEFGIIMFIRVLFIASMIFIIGYVFGGFSKKPVLKTITKIAAILVIVLFIAINGILMRSFFGRHDGKHNWPYCNERAEREHRP